MNFIKKYLLRELKKDLKKERETDLTFKSNGFLTLGVEIELQLIDAESLSLVPKSREILAKDIENKKLKPEFYLSTLEINTDICKDVHQVSSDLGESINKLKPIAENEGVKLSTTACHPFSSYRDCIISPSDRYHDLIDRNQWLTKRMTVYGLHVHIGMKNSQDCINYINFFLRFIPHLLALSASSPFWQGDDTGLASCRPTTYEALPTAGLPYRFNSWNEFENLYKTLKACNSIKSMNDLWWDIRPSPKYGTLEIRSCDGVATLAETLGIVSFIHLLAYWFTDNSDWLHSVTQPAPWILRENKWRAMRHGLNADIVTTSSGETKSIKADILDWLSKLEPYAEKLNYTNYIQSLKDIIQHGNSADRQRKVYERTNSLQEVVKFNITEFENSKPTL